LGNGRPARNAAWSTVSRDFTSMACPLIESRDDMV
jgi:hypothetical protein